MLELSEGRQTAELEVWSALRDLEEQFGRLLSRVGDAAQRREAVVGYVNARRELDEPIERLREHLVRALPEPRALRGESWVEQIFAAILIHFDERELGFDERLPRMNATLLQTEYANLRDGGERFYVFLERALRSRVTPPLVLQLFLFCMRSGFCGRFPTAEDPERLAYVTELTDWVSPSRVGGSDAPRGTPQGVPQVSAIGGRRFPIGNYVVAAFVLFVLWSSLQVAASVHEVHLVGMTSCEDP
ncbi:MAG: DotU family type IV/VI secretion system protein [Polyangiaceae bacterium]